MTPAFATDLLHRALSLMLITAGPMLFAALLIGVLVSLLQAVTQIQEQTMTFIPKLLIVALVFVFTLPWMMRGMVEFTVQLIQMLPLAAQ